MIYPEDDEQTFGQNHYTVNYPFSIENLKTKSPTLPLHFDRRYLPQDLCQKQLIGMSQCLLLYNINESLKERMCTLETSKFQSCRRKRDLRIISAIHKWEVTHLRGLTKQNRAFYLRGLGFKMDRLKDDLSRQPSTMAGLSRIEEIEGQLKQLKWRVGYLNTVQEQLNKQKQ